jgi:hypothetical protein
VPPHRAGREGGRRCHRAEQGGWSRGGRIVGGRGGQWAGGRQPIPRHGRRSGGRRWLAGGSSQTGRHRSREGAKPPSKVAVTEAGRHRGGLAGRRVARRSAWRRAATARAVVSCGWGGGLRKNNPKRFSQNLTVGHGPPDRFTPDRTCSVDQISLGLRPTERFTGLVGCPTEQVQSSNTPTGRFPPRTILGRLHPSIFLVTPQAEIHSKI